MLFYLKHAYNNFEKYTAILSITGMCFFITLQVFFRYVLNESLVWSEELGRYLFIFAVYLGCGYALQEDSHLEVTILRHYVPYKLKYIIYFFNYLCIFIFSAYCLIYGIEMLNHLISTGQKSPAMRIPIYIVYISIPLGLGIMTIRSLEKIIKLITKQKNILE